MKPLFGYPGGKSRAVKNIKAALDWDDDYYKLIIEPFCGGASFSLSCDGPVWINDMDADLMALWICVRDYPDRLIRRVQDYNPSADTFYVLKERLRNPRPMPRTQRTILSRAIDKLVVHKISYSNMGEMSGSPVGGKNQTGKWKFDVRWNVNSICAQIKKTHAHVANWTMTCLDYRYLLRDARKTDFLFVDPPYVEAGAKCYKHAFTLKDHEVLASHLKALVTADFAVTYDRCALIDTLYSWADRYDLTFNYFMSSAYRAGQTMKQGKEVLIIG